MKVALFGNENSEEMLTLLLPALVQAQNVLPRSRCAINRENQPLWGNRISTIARIRGKSTSSNHAREKPKARL